MKPLQKYLSSTLTFLIVLIITLFILKAVNKEDECTPVNSELGIACDQILVVPNNPN